MSVNELYIAAAGSGKTRFIIDRALQNNDGRTLITTFTIANEQSIREKLLKANNGCIPPRIIVQTWFSFLLEHGVRPYRYWNKPATGMKFVSERSALHYKGKQRPIYWSEEDFEKHYFTSSMNVYSDKLSKLVFRCNEKSDGYVIKRLEKIFRHIYIDEVQDMAGWDLKLIKLFLGSSINLTMVGDPRQAVYSTHYDTKLNKYENGKIKKFISEECSQLLCNIDETTLNNSYRNSQPICELSSKLYPQFSPCGSSLSISHNHTGIHFVRKKEVKKYYDHFKPLQLRLRKDVKLCVEAPCMNFGESKGLEAKHVLIYPTKDMLGWLCDKNVNLADKTKAQFYVALTRAFFSVGIVVEDNFNKTVAGISMWD